MSFWELNHPPQRIAAIDASTAREKTYGELRADVDRLAGIFCECPRKSLVLLLARNQYECFVAYLACLNTAQAALLVDSSLHHDLLSGLIAKYQPEFIVSGASEFAVNGYAPLVNDGVLVLRKSTPEQISIHEDLALLLNTSGSTGSPKLVRLSAKNIQANAASITEYLKLHSNEVAVTSLPMAYSYGLSVINSHLAVGATIVLTDHPILRREFWDTVDRYGCTSFAGVPYSYQMLLRTGLLNKKGSSLSTFTQAGGGLSADDTRQMHQLAQERRSRFFVMYGQTEATARISYVPCEKLSAKVGSIGRPIPGGNLDIDSSTGELIYTGPNVMMGYAESREDLAKGDELGGVLHTGDLARQDEDGFFYITGRIKRFLKLFGKRFNLDEVERILNVRCGLPFACFGCDDLLTVAFEGADTNVARVTSTVSEVFGLPRTAIRILAMDRLPRTSRDKIDYSALGDWKHNRTNIASVQAVSSAGRTPTR